MRTTLSTAVALCLAVFVTYGLWFTRSHGWTEGGTRHRGWVPADHPTTVESWETRGWLGYVTWQGTSAPPERPADEPVIYGRRRNGRLVGSDEPLVITCLLTAAAWIGAGWHLRRWIVETPSIARALRTWRARLAILGFALLPAVVGVLSVVSPPGRGPGFGGAFVGGAIGMVLTFTLYAAPVAAALGYALGRWIDGRIPPIPPRR